VDRGSPGDELVVDVLLSGRREAPPVTLAPEQVVTLTEVLVILLGIGITWVVYHGSENAELPGEATNPPPGEVDDATPETGGRTLS
jgi:hypothetical protein